MSNISRRRFFEDSLLAAAAAATVTTPVALSASEKRSVGANDRIVVAIIGCGIRGKQHASELAQLPECEIRYVCDPDSERATELASELVAKNRPRLKAVQDLRVILDDKSVAAVFIAAPNHWHALATIWAMQAGKDVYVEKPVSHNVSEGRRMVQAARKYGRICQVGTQNRSNGALAAAIRYIHEGKLGEVKLARSIVYGRRDSIGGPSPCAIPPSVDYNLWAGPATLSTLTRPKFHYDWHWFWNTGNGELGNNNIHSLDICRWGLRLTGLGRSVISYGGRFGYSDSAETPNTQVVLYDFGGKSIISETRGLSTQPFNANFKSGWIFTGTNGIIADTSLFDLDGKRVRTFEGKTESHFANFLDAVRRRETTGLHADILEGHQSTALCHLGNISYRLGVLASNEDIRKRLDQWPGGPEVLKTFDRTCQHLAENHVGFDTTQLKLGRSLRLDLEHESFLEDPEAEALLHREYRKPFIVPAEKDV